MSHIFDMINRNKQNRALQKQRQESRADRKTPKSPNITLSYKKASPENLARLKRQIWKKARKEQVKYWFGSITVTGIIVYYLWEKL